ncbi:iron-sulfur cluster assembly accessory protein [Candidatus Poribacteria bacterium]|nr:iron-sulfur cluster assembly accessory protein [Candidatus Poribacteria bacterium]MYK95055.1 iron-sulfur cluster assembly accessory protein [Candidatus Poribacteria bacterium]
MKNFLKKFTGNETPLLTVTETAQQKIHAVIEAEEVEVEGLRISIQGRTATAFQYSLGLATEAQADDVVVECGNFNVLVDAESAPDLQGAVIDYVDDLNSSGFNIENPNTPTWDNPKAQQIQELIDERINPAVAAHGGQIELLNVEEDSIYIHMGGGCQGCGMANVTLKHGIEAMIQEAFPEIKHVVDTTDHASGDNPYYSPSKG